MIRILRPEHVEETSVTASSDDVRIDITSQAGDNFVLSLPKGEVLDYVADRLYYYKLADSIAQEDDAYEF